MYLGNNKNKKNIKRNFSFSIFFGLFLIYRLELIRFPALYLISFRTFKFELLTVELKILMS